jgi:hypothetical protein
LTYTPSFDESGLQIMNVTCVLHGATTKLKCSETLNIIPYGQEVKNYGHEVWERRGGGG